MDVECLQPIDQFEATLRRNWTDVEHKTWSMLFQRQSERIKGLSCSTFEHGMELLRYDSCHLPDPVVISQFIRSYTGWGLTSAENEYLGATEWFDHIVSRRFPVTAYIRDAKDLDFTPLPDLFHEYFGHLAFFTDRAYADIVQQFGALYLAGDCRQRTEIAKLWWFSIEFALVLEQGEKKIFGAGLLSSPGELDFALTSRVKHYPFTIERVIRAKPAAYSFHDVYFVLESIEHLKYILEDYSRREGLVPTLQRNTSLSTSG
ncbi:MAG: aromatic amino acid hydroxylase [Herpetosiphon sp.]